MNSDTVEFRQQQQQDGGESGTATVDHHDRNSGGEDDLEIQPGQHSSPSTPLILSDKVIRAIFLLLGVGILIPWNAFVSAKPYFTARLCAGEGQKDIVNFEKWFGLVWNSCSVLSLGLIIGGQTISDLCKKRNDGSGGTTTTTPTALNTLLGTTSSSQGTNNSADLEDNGSRGSNGSINSGGRAGSITSSASGGNHDHSFVLVMIPLMLYLGVFLVQAVLVLVPDVPPHAFLTLTMVGLAVCGTCGAIATAGIVSTAGLFPSSLGINPFFEGQAVGGVLVSVANFATAIFQDPTDFWDQHCTPLNTSDFNTGFTLASEATTTTRIEADSYVSSARVVSASLNQEDVTCTPYTVLDFAVFAYFSAGCVVLFLCLLGYHQIHRYQDMQHRDDYEVIQDAIPPSSEQPVPPQTPSIDDVNMSPIGLELNGRMSDRASNDGGAKERLSIEGNDNDPIHQLPPTQHTSDGIFRHDDNNDENESIDEEFADEVDEGAIFSAVKGPATCIFLVFTVTLCLFPSWISELASNSQCKSHFRIHNDLYVPFCFVFFNIGDLCGRMLAERVKVQQIRHLSRKLVVAALLRCSFLPIFLLCRTNLSSDSFAIPSDLFSGAIQFAFAITNGLLVSTAFMHAPHLVAQTTEMQERSSEIMTFSVYAGLLSGSMLAFPFMEMAT